MKIIEAINSMISNSDKITNVTKNDKEYFFLFNNKHKWSIINPGIDQYNLFLYPKDDITIETLAGFDVMDFANYSDYIIFKSEEIKTREATESFSELYQIVISKLFGVDDILNDIISIDL